MLKKLVSNVKRIFNKKGEGYLGMVIAIAITAAIVMATSPDLMTKVQAQITDAFDAIDAINISE